MIPIRMIDSLILYIGLFIFCGTFDAVLTTFDPNIGGSDSDGNMKMQLTTGFIYLMTAILVLFRVESFMKFSSRHITIMLFLMIPLFSVFWSISPETTLRRVVALLGTSLFGIYLAFAFQPGRIIRALAVVYSLVAAISLIFILILPAYGTHQAGEYAGVWRGLFAQKNEFGASMAIGLLALALCPKQTCSELILCRVATLLCSMLLVMSESRAAWLSLAAAASIALPLHYMSGRGIRSAIKAIAFLLIMAIGIGFIVQNSHQILTALGKDPTLTGRTGVWELTLDRAMLRPILGYGYRAYWIGDNKLRLQPTENWSDGIGHAHNTYIDMMAELGLLGVTSFVLIVGILVTRLGRRINRQRDFFNIWAIGCLIFILIRGLAESTVLQHADINWVLFIYLFVVTKEIERTESQRLSANNPQEHYQARKATLQPHDASPPAATITKIHQALRQNNQQAPARAISRPRSASPRSRPGKASIAAPSPN